jgi:GNAT superfamily N-acetyltransferase
MLNATAATLMHQVSRRAGLHVLHVFSRRLRPVPAPRLAGVSCRVLQHRELGRRPGDVCVGVFVDGEPAGYAWYAYEDAPHVNGVRVRIPPHLIYRFKVYVLPAYRGRGLAPYLYRAADELVARPGRERVVTCVAVQNLSSVIASVRAGDIPHGLLAYWQWRRHFVAVHSPATLDLGLNFYRAPAAESLRSARAGSRESRAET